VASDRDELHGADGKKESPAESDIDSSVKIKYSPVSDLMVQFSIS